MPEVVFPLDSQKKFTEQQIVGHNRWHPDIPAQVHVKPGDSFRVHCREWFDGAIVNDDSADDILNAPLAGVHVLSGPIAVEGAEPGDLLIVDILDVGPIPQEDSGPLAGQGWGYTGVFATRNGGGFLTEQFPDAYKVIWDFRGGVATSRHVPGVSFTGIVHPGLMGTAPSADLLAKWNAREQALIDTDPNRVPPLALPPNPDSAILGSLTGDDFTRAAAEAARTAPPRENGGNQDIKNLTKGSRGLLPGVRRRREALDGRPALLPGRRRDHVLRRDRDGRVHGPARRPDQGRHGDLRRERERDLHAGQRRPALRPVAGVLRHLGDAVGEQRYLDSHLSYQRACLHAIDYLQKFGYSDIQAYMILGAAPIEGRLSGVVDIPNSCSTVYIPTAIFDIDVRPSANGPQQVDPGQGVPVSRA